MELSIQERLKDLRVERGLTLEQLEEQINPSKSALGSCEAKDFKDISPSPYQVGDQVEMLYNADNPQQYYIPDSAGENWVFLLGGALFFVMGLGFIVLLTKTWLLPIILGK